MKNIQIYGITGAIVLMFAVITEALVSDDSLHFVWIHLVVGVLLLLLFVFRGGINLISTAAARRNIGRSAGVTVYSGLFVGILALANYVSYRHEFFHYDSTEQKIHTLAVQTKSVLDSLPSAVTMRAFYVGADVDSEVDSLRKRLERYSDKIKWLVVDPEKSPELVERYGISESGTIHFTLQDEASARESKISRNITEQEVVNAILKLTRGREKTIYYLVGHGEPDLSDGTSENGYLFLKEAIEGENVLIKELVLSQTKQIPSDASALLLAAPQKGFLEPERALLKHYLSSGGSAVLLHEPRRSDEIVALVEPFGIDIGHDVIVDQAVKLFAGPTLGVEPMVRDYGNHAITADFTEGTIFSIASSVKSAKGEVEGVVVSELAFSSKKSWAERSVELLFSDEPQAALEDSDIVGPVSVACAAEVTPTKQNKSQTATGRLVVFGDADFVSNVNIRQLFNRDFFLNSLNWVIGEDEQVTIRPKSLRQSTVGITSSQFSVMFLLTAVLLPEALLLGGLSVWWRRRKD